MKSEIERQVDYRYPAADERRLGRAFERQIALDDRVYAVIDDDPTGGQTVNGIEVYTAWDEQSLLNAFQNAGRMFFIMTNSRSMSAEESHRTHIEIMKNMQMAALRANRRYEAVSRGDSTLRGHYPLEPDIIAGAMGGAKQLLIPYFGEGARYTIGDVHYLRQGGALTPVGESEFSRDKTFGYRASELKMWIEEKTGGKVPHEKVGTISLDALRQLDFDTVEKVLRGPCSHIVVNAACDDDLRAFAVPYLRSVAAGEKFVARTAAGWPRVIGNVPKAPLLDGAQLACADGQGGLVMIGSHVKRTSQQLDAMRRIVPQAAYLELDQHLALNPMAMDGETLRVSREASKHIRAGRTCVIYTRRERLDVRGTPEEELRITRRIADAVTQVVSLLDARPGFLIAKGGITASDIAVKALGVKRALILGQAAPGVPVWRMGEGSKYPGMAYIIFPGNVGERETLGDMVKMLSERRHS